MHLQDRGGASTVSLGVKVKACSFFVYKYLLLIPACHTCAQLSDELAAIKHKDKNADHSSYSPGPYCSPLGQHRSFFRHSCGLLSDYQGHSHSNTDCCILLSPNHREWLSHSSYCIHHKKRQEAVLSTREKLLDFQDHHTLRQEEKHSSVGTQMGGVHDDTLH